MEQSQFDNVPRDLTSHYSARSVQPLNELPVPALEADNDSHVSLPRPLVRPRQRRTESNQVMDFLARRLARQTLRQQRSQSVAASTLHASPLEADDMDVDPEISSDTDIPSLTAADCLASPLSLPSNHSPHHTSSSSVLPSPPPPPTSATPPTAQHIIPAASSSTNLDPLTTESSWSASNSLPPSCVNLEADDSYVETPEDLTWLRGGDLKGSLAEVMRKRGILSYTSSAEAAQRLPQLIRNVPRMRKRQQKKREHRLKKDGIIPEGEDSRIANEPIFSH